VCSSDLNDLSLPRYGLGNYLTKQAEKIATPEEKKQMDNLSRAGKRLMGFCRTNLFKRLESSGQSFLLSVDRHILRNYVYIYAIDNGLPLPIGIQNAELLDVGANDEDSDAAGPVQAVMDYEEDTDDNNNHIEEQVIHQYSQDWYLNSAKKIYEIYSSKQKNGSVGYAGTI
jgi:hypothetical protein